MDLVMDEAECHRCGATISRAVILDSTVTEWFHKGEWGAPIRGCRAATYRSDAGWNDAIPRTWVAEPKRK